MASPADKDREAFLAEIRARMEAARARGESPDQIQEEMRSVAHRRVREQAPIIATRVSAWWRGLRNFLIIGALALGCSVALALFVEHSYAAPSCREYALLHNLRYTSFDYPPLLSDRGRGGYASSGDCQFLDAAGRRQEVSFAKAAHSTPVELLVAFALQIDLTTTLWFLAIALIAAMFAKRSRAAAQWKVEEQPDTQS